MNRRLRITPTTAAVAAMPGDRGNPVFAEQIRPSRVSTSNWQPLV
jgi:hypothetical protein